MLRHHCSRSGSYPRRLSPSTSQLSPLWLCNRTDAPAQSVSCRAASPAEEESVHHIRNALGTAIARLIDSAEGGTEPTHKHSTQRALTVARTGLHGFRCECRHLSKLPRRHAVDNTSHEHDAQLIGQVSDRPFRDVSNHIIRHPAVLLLQPCGAGLSQRRRI